MSFISKISIITGVVAIALALLAQVEIVDGYKISSKKNRALYGLNILKYADILYVSLISFLLSIISLFFNGKKSYKILGLVISILSVVIFLSDLWTLFI